MSLTKSGIAQKICQEVSLPRKQANDLVDLLFSILRGRMAQGETIKIFGLGNFFVRDRASRIGRNPKTGSPMAIEARRVPVFKVSKALKGDIMSRYAHRLDDDGKEDTSLPPRQGEERALSSFINNTDN